MKYIEVTRARADLSPNLAPMLEETIMSWSSQLAVVGLGPNSITRQVVTKQAVSPHPTLALAHK